MPYAGPHICQSCRCRKSWLKTRTKERMALRAAKEKERRKRLGKTLLASERERYKKRHASKEYREKNLDWQRKNKAYLKTYRHDYRQKQHAKVKTWDQNKRARKHAAGKLDLEEWKAILEKYNHSCYYCGKKGVELEQEHKVPLIRGGKHSAENVVPACRECNARKFTKTPEEFEKSSAYPRAKLAAA